MQDSLGMFKAAERIAEAEGLQLIQDKGVHCPCTDGLVVKVPPLSPYASREETIKWLASIYHEVGHNAPGFKEIFRLTKRLGIDMDSIPGRVLNIVEDNRNERNKLGEYLGRDRVLSEMNAICGQAGYSNLKDVKELGEWEVPIYVQALSLAERCNWQPHVPEVAESWRTLVPDSIWGKLEPFIPRFSEMTDAESSWALSKDILEALGIEFKEEDEDDGRGEGDSPDDPESSPEGEGEAEEGAGRDDGEASGSAESSKGSRGTPDGGEGQSEVSPSDVLLHDHSLSEEAAYLDSPIPDSGVDFTPWTKMQVIHAKPSSIDPDIERYYTDGTRLSHRVKGLLQSQSQTRWRSRQESGRLHCSQLYRVPVEGAVDVFKQRRSALDVRNTSLCVALDASGSMFPTRWDISAAALALFADALQPLNMESLFFSYSESSKVGCSHRILKSWKERLNGRDVLKRVGRWQPKHIQNSDGESLMWAGQQLLSRRAERRILLVLSDGQPACDNPGAAGQYTKDVIQYLSKRMEVYGIGIETSSVEDFYDSYSVLMRASELEQCLFDVIKSKLL